MTAPAFPATDDARLLQRFFAAQEAERQQVARALHNEIGQAVSAIKMSAHLAIDETDPAQRGEDLREIVRIADQTVARLRDLYAALRPPQIDTLGLEASLRGELERLPAAQTCLLRLDLADLSPRPSPAVELAAFRIAQDALAQMADATPSRLSIRLAPAEGGMLRLDIDHDGRAPAPDEAALMRARARAVGGELLSRAGEQGVRVQAFLPAQTAPDARS